MSRWLVGSSRIRKFASESISLARKTRPRSPPLKSATRILDLTGGTIVNYIGNYDYYLEKHDELTRIYVEAEPKAQAAQMTEQTVAQDGSGTDKKADWQTQKAEQARIRKLENTLKKAEERIAELEDLIAGIDEECADPANATNSAKLGADRQTE